MTPLHLKVDIPGRRADQFLADSLPQLTRSAAQKLLEEGAVTLNGRPVKKNYKTCPGDELVVVLPDPAPVDIVPQNIPLDVVYEDDDVIAVNKPVGLVVHPAAGHPDGTLVTRCYITVEIHSPESTGLSGPALSTASTGTPRGSSSPPRTTLPTWPWRSSSRTNSLYREYEAVCVGNLKEDEGTVNAPIARHPTDRKKMAVNFLQGRPAITHWSVLERFPGYTHVQCRLETGRTHQIRVHMAHMGHPLLGDVVYGSKKPWPGLAGQCLHARRLSFIHPRTGERMTLECPLPQWFQDVLTKLGRLV